MVQGFTDQWLGKIPTSSPTASRRSRQMFLTLAASLGSQTHKGDVKCAFLQGDLDEQHADDDDGDNFKIEYVLRTSPRVVSKVAVGASSVCSGFEGVYGLVNAPRSWYHRVATDLRNMRGEESLTEPCLWTFCDENGVIHALSLVYVDDFMLACSVSPFGKHVSESINHTYEWEGGFEISFTEYAKEISIITLPSHRRRDRQSQITPLDLSRLRALNGQLVAPLSLLMGHTQATVDTIYEVNKLAGKATVWARMPLEVHARHSLVVVTYTDAGWTTRPDGTSQGGQLVFIANSELLRGKEPNMSLISGHPSRLRRVARSSSAAETQAAADGDDEAVYIRLCLKEILFRTAGFAKMAIGSKTNSCCFGGGLSWCLRHIYSLFVLLSWLERQEIWPGSACAQTESR